MEQLCKILIVDDEILVRQGIKHHLNWEDHGFQIVGEASNGREALEMIEQLRPHIIITDIVMPVLDGEELTRIVKQRYPDMEVIVLSSYGEFSYVRSTFQSGVADYILKPKLETQELLETLKRTARKIPSIQYGAQAGDGNISVERIVDKLLSGYEPDEASAMAANSFAFTSFCLIGVLGGRTYLQHSGSELGLQLVDVLDSQVCTVYQSAENTSGLDIYLANLEQEAYSELVHSLKELAGERAEHAPTLVWAVTSLFDSINQVGEVFQNRLKKLIDAKFYFPDQYILLEEEMLSPTEPAGTFNLRLFTEEMKRGQFDRAFELLNQHLDMLSEHYEAPPFEFKSFISNTIFNITILLGNLEYDTHALESAKYSYFKSIDEAVHVDEAKGLLQSFLNDVKREIADAQQHGNSGMKKLLEYIEEHYDQPLSLTSLAHHFHFNPSYLSSYFTAHNKEGFSEYLNKVRVEKAATMLRNDDHSISEISSRVGYSDHSYFTKVFKKLMGFSPSQYRRRYLNGKRE